MSAAYELRESLGPDHRITVIGDGDRFSFTPSNPWLAVGWRESADITLPAAEYLAKNNEVWGMARFGDPETQVYLTRLENDLVELLDASASGTLGKHELKWSPLASVCVASSGTGLASRAACLPRARLWPAF